MSAGSVSSPRRGVDRRSERAWPPQVFALAVGAVALRLLLLLGRGDYMAFDEGFYLLLGRSLMTGDGYSLIGLPHTALSPFFPLLAGALGALIDSWVWGGRLVAAAASGLLVLPAWSIFRRLGSRRVATIAVALVAVMPSLTPFVVPFWIGADLWVGAEPLLHLLLYTGVAAWLWADESGRLLRWAVTGAAFGLAFLARPEAIITWGLLGLGALWLAWRRRSRHRLGGALLMGVAFVLVASPYWLYIHDVTGRWDLTGRGVSPVANAVQRMGADREAEASAIEGMLWADDDAYEQYLYGLAPSGLRLRADYWGVAPDTVVYPSEAAPTRAVDSVGQPMDTSVADDAAVVSGPGEAADGPPPAVVRFFWALGMIFPVLLYPFVLLGLARPRERVELRVELPVTLSVLGTALAIAGLVAVDPRTQLILVPMLALYAAHGFGVLERVVRERSGSGFRSALRPGFIELTLAVVAIVWLLTVDGRRLYLSLSLGSPHHIVAEQNRAVAEELDDLLGTEQGPVASWHPAIAVYADRDWRVLPFADLPGIVRYLDAAGADAMVLSAYYPPDLGVEALNTRYLVLPVPEAGGERAPWRVRLLRGDTIRAFGRLHRVEPGYGER